MTRIASGFAAAAALIAFALPAFADSRLFSVRADKPGATIDQAFVNGQALAVAGKGGGVTFFRMDNPAGAIDCRQHFTFVVSTGERQDSDVDLCSENWQVTLHLTARAIVAEPRPEPVPPAPPAPPAAAAEPPELPPPPAAPPAPSAAVVTGAIQTVTITTDDPAIGIEGVFLERQPVQILGRQANSVEIAVRDGPGRIQCERDLGIKLSDGRTMARKVNICDHNWSVLVTLAGEEAPAVAAPPAKTPPVPPVARVAPGELPQASPSFDAQGGEGWFFSTGAGTVALGYGVPRTETGEFAASCRPGSGQATVRILRPMPGGQVGGPIHVTLAAGPVTRTFQAVASPMTDVAAGPRPQFNVPPADMLWQALIHEAVLIAQIGEAPPYTIPLQGSAQPVRQFLTACGLPGQAPLLGEGPPADGAPAAIAGPPGAGFAYACNDGSFLQIQFDARRASAFVVEPGAPPAMLFRVPARPEVARYASGPAFLVGVGEVIRWSRFGEPPRVCRPRLQ